MFDWVRREGDIYCLIFEYVEGCDYKKLIEKIQPVDAKFYLYQILKGLHYCHSRGIMHRDIKPQNVIIDHQKRYVSFLNDELIS